MNEKKDLEVSQTGSEITMVRKEPTGTPVNGFRLPGKVERELHTKEGTFFEIPTDNEPKIKLKIKFFPSSIMMSYRKDYLIQQVNKKSGKMEWIEHEEKKTEVSKKMILDAVTDWQNMYNQTGEVLPFSRENLDIFLDFAGSMRINKEDENGEQMTINAFIVDCIVQSELHFGKKKT